MTITIDNKSIFVLFLVSITIFVASLYHRNISYDDAFFAEQAYWLNKSGYVRSELFSNYRDWGERQFIYLKLHVWQTALVANIAGWSPYIFKLIPLSYFLLFLCFAYVYYRRYLYTEENTPFYLFTALLLLNTYIIHFSFENRPEMMQICIGFASFLSVRHGINYKKPAYIFLAGSLAGIAVLFHFNGIIFITAGIGLIIYLRCFRYVSLFLVAAALIAPVYWYEMISNDAVGLGIHQLLNYPSLSTGELSLKYIMVKLLYSPKRFFSHLFDFSYILLFILALYFARHTIKTRPEIKILLAYFIFSELTLALISPGGKSMYIALHIPYVLFIVVILIREHGYKPFNKIMLIAILFYTITNVGHVVGLVEERNAEIVQQNSVIIKKYNINKTDKVLAPAIFVFNEIENARISASEIVKGIDGDKTLSEQKDVTFQYANNHKYNFLILRKEDIPGYTDNNLIIGQTYHGYTYSGSDFGYFIFRKINL